MLRFWLVIRDQRNGQESLLIRDISCEGGQPDCWTLKIELFTCWQFNVLGRVKASHIGHGLLTAHEELARPDSSFLCCTRWFASTAFFDGYPNFAVDSPRSSWVAMQYMVSSGSARRASSRLLRFPKGPPDDSRDPPLLSEFAGFGNQAGSNPSSWRNAGGFHRCDSNTRR